MKNTLDCKKRPLQIETTLESISSTADTALLTEVPDFGSARGEGLQLPGGLGLLWIPDGWEEVEEEDVSCCGEGTATDGDGSFSVEAAPSVASFDQLQLQIPDEVDVWSSPEQTWRWPRPHPPPPLET